MKRTALLRIGARALLAAACVGAPMVALGCRDVDKIEIPNPFRQTPERPLADVPVPNGFRYLEQGSYIFDRNYRVARLRYSGTPHIDDAVAFFKEQMPLSKWNLVKEGQDGGRWVQFQNEFEEMKVLLEREAGVTSIQIDISPKKA
jgi:hypothetical protein